MNKGFVLNLFVVDNRSEDRVPVFMRRATREDIEASKDDWLTYWGSEYIQDSGFVNFAMVSEQDELIALVSYEIMRTRLVVHIVYMESQPESNPVMVSERKYSGIGRALIAFGIKLSVEHGFGGDVILEAKNDNLLEHYVVDFDGVLLPAFDSTMPRTVLIADQAAVKIVSDYMEEN